ncbi:hypothetical protein PROFUN_05360 [Planoprotostelium fungivorum]|uniref:Uncharacterized protein n=1 Tax=Planoprotostelium fungivorum TaxID=1890364 RepID=A0A2P6NR51_9EUKA|nr:hypothetical protein PROFUN_05360 [Planoprotostelium fungivorum]
MKHYPHYAQTAATLRATPRRDSKPFPCTTSRSSHEDSPHQGADALRDRSTVVTSGSVCMYACPADV